MQSVLPESGVGEWWGKEQSGNHGPNVEQVVGAS